MRENFRKAEVLFVDCYIKFRLGSGDQYLVCFYPNFYFKLSSDGAAELTS